MIEQYQIILDNPCKEKLDQMSTTDKGFYCTSCEKEVIDFTNLNNEAIAKLIKANPQGMCARMTSDQLEQTYEVHTLKKSWLWIKLKVALLAGLLWGTRADAQGLLNACEVTEWHIDNNKSDVESKKTNKGLNMKICMYEEADPLPGATIIITYFNGFKKNINSDKDGKAYLSHKFTDKIEQIEVRFRHWTPRIIKPLEIAKALENNNGILNIALQSENTQYLIYGGIKGSYVIAGSYNIRKAIEIVETLDLDITDENYDPIPNAQISLQRNDFTFAQSKSDEDGLATLRLQDRQNSKRYGAFTIVVKKEGYVTRYLNNILIEDDKLEQEIVLKKMPNKVVKTQLPSIMEEKVSSAATPQISEKQNSDNALLKTSFDINFSPNPTNGSLHYQHNASEMLTMELIDISGKIIKTIHLYEPNGIIYLSDVKPGTYTVRTFSNKNEITKQIIVLP